MVIQSTGRQRAMSVASVALAALCSVMLQPAAAADVQLLWSGDEWGRVFSVDPTTFEDCEPGLEELAAGCLGGVHARAAVLRELQLQHPSGTVRLLNGNLYFGSR